MSEPTQAAGTARRVPPREVDYEDVDDVIGIAAELQDLERDRLSVEDLQEVARDLEIPERHVRPAIEELERRRKEALAAAENKARRRRVVLIAAVAVVAILVIWAIVGDARLGGLETEATRARAQLINVVERQRATVRQWQGQPDGPEKMAELSGAENRVRIERKRYDDAASAYNEAATSFPGSVWRGLFGRPEALPLSHTLSEELTRF